jgi:hypothetical protein
MRNSGISAENDPLFEGPTPFMQRETVLPEYHWSLAFLLGQDPLRRNSDFVGTFRNAFSYGVSVSRTSSGCPTSRGSKPSEYKREYYMTHGYPWLGKIFCMLSSHSDICASQKIIHDGHAN